MAASPQRNSIASVEEDDDVCSTAAVGGGTNVLNGEPQFPIPTTLHSRCMRVLRWDDGFATRAIRGYRLFMGLKIRLEDWDATKLAPPPIIERVWQQHILDVNHYAEACSGDGAGSNGSELPAGGGRRSRRRIHHNPDDGFWNATYSSRVRATELAVEGSLPEQVDREIWSFAHSGSANNNSDDDEQEERNCKRRRLRQSGSSTGTSSRGSSAGPRRTDAITFFVRWANNNNHRPNDLYFKIRPDTKMARVFERFNMHWNQNDGGGGGGGNGETDEDFTFFFGGKMVRPIDTANTLGLVSDDMINATRCKAVLDSD